MGNGEGDAVVGDGAEVAEDASCNVGADGVGELGDVEPGALGDIEDGERGVEEEGDDLVCLLHAGMMRVVSVRPLEGDAA